MNTWLPALAALLVVAPAALGDDRVDQLERRIEILTQEIEQMRLGAVADTGGYVSRFGFAPAASKIYGVAHGVSLGGYGEMLFENFDRRRDDGAEAGRPDALDFLRQILYFGFKFNDELLFNSEIEYEHAGVRGEASAQVDPATGRGTATLSGDVVVEFAYLDWLLRPEFGIRAGLVLVPLGLVNELHEPPVFLGARRPEVEQRIIPSTWRANGAGVFGEFGNGLAYRAYVVEGLDGTRFTAGGGIRGGRQSGSRSLMTHPALAARLDWSGAPGLLVGAAVYRGGAAQRPLPLAGDPPRVLVGDLHARWQWRGLEVRGLLAGGRLDGAARLSDALELAGASRLGRRFAGGYLEAAYDLLPLLGPGTRYALLAHVRGERYDTQEDVPGGADQPAFDRRVLTIGAAFKPHPNVVLKADRQERHNPARTETDQWNLALGFLF